MKRKEDYLNELKNKNISEHSKLILENQITNYYSSKREQIRHNYKIGDYVFLKKGTLLHGTYKNIEGLREIVKDGLISSWFIDGRSSKYPSSVGVWNLTKDYYLKDYINFYSGGTIRYFNQHDDKKETEVIKYSDLNNIVNIIKKKNYLVWQMEQTKEARFLPSLVQNKVQIGIIFNAEKSSIKELIKNGDILNVNYINDYDVKEFVNEVYYERFIIDRKNKDDFFTNRESAILFGIPANFIEGILVGRIYEKDSKILKEIKKLIPNSYICNLDGKVIVE